MLKDHTDENKESLIRQECVLFSSELCNDLWRSTGWTYALSAAEPRPLHYFHLTASDSTWRRGVSQKSGPLSVSGRWFGYKRSFNYSYIGQI